MAEGEYALTALDKDDPSVESYDYSASVKEQIETNWGITLSDAEFKSGTVNCSSSTANQVKTFTYTKDDGTVVTTTEKRFTLTNIGSLSLKNSNSVSVFVKSSNYLNVFKAFCADNGIALTDGSKIVVNGNNMIIGIK